ncbi:MAG TPA: VWA domain-containing protein [Steroidobacteraceae bacterium]|nr:VWA domain-containing protein [Steroidobacteraceae bacterium]
MIHFAWPWLALLAPLPWLHYRLRSAAAPRGAALFLPFLAAIGTTSDRAAHRSRRAQLLFAALWLLLVAAAARPQWLGDPLPVPTTGRKLLLAVDVSGSMATPDMEGSATRLQVVQQVAGRFIEGRHGDQVGLILFGTQPYLQAPLTPDLATVHRFLDEAVVGVAGPETAIGDAIGLALKKLGASASTVRERHDGPGQAVLILLTDGESNAGAMPPLEAARLAAQTGLRIYTIGVGAIPQPGFFGTQGNTDLDEDTLKAIAKTTGGEYFRAADAETLQDVYQRIDRLEPAAGRDQWFRPADEWFGFPLGAALLLSVPAACVGAGRWI